MGIFFDTGEVGVDVGFVVDCGEESVDCCREVDDFFFVSVCDSVVDSSDVVGDVVEFGVDGGEVDFHGLASLALCSDSLVFVFVVEFAFDGEFDEVGHSGVFAVRDCVVPLLLLRDAHFDVYLFLVFGVVSGVIFYPARVSFSHD